MTFNQVEVGIVNYINNEIAIKAQGPMKFLIYTGMALGTPKLEEMFVQYKSHPMIKALGVIDESDDIDIDKLYSAMKKAISKVDTFEIWGIRFNERDVDSLYNYIRKG